MAFFLPQPPNFFIAEKGIRQYVMLQIDTLDMQVSSPSLHASQIFPFLFDSHFDLEPIPSHDLEY